MSSEVTFEKIIRYGKFLDRALGKSEDQQVLIVLEKLDRLPISLDHLQVTGIGKTVNAYRKCSDPVGMKAKAIVNKWKGLVQAAIAEDQSQQSDSSPMQTDGESEHTSDGNATDEESVKYNSFEKNSSPVIHKKEETTTGQGKASGMEAYNATIKGKADSSKDEKLLKKPYGNSTGLEQYSGHKSLKSDSEGMARQLKQSLPCNSLSKDGKCPDVSEKEKLIYLGKSQDSTNKEVSRSSNHRSSQKGHSSHSLKSGSTTQISRDELQRDRSRSKDGKKLASASELDASCKNASIVSDAELLPQNVTSAKSQSAEKNLGISDISGKHAGNLDLSNSLKRKTNESGDVDIPKKKQLLEPEKTKITTDLPDCPANNKSKSAHTRHSGHHDHSSSKRNSSSLKDSSSLSKEDSQKFPSGENSTSQSKSMIREASSSKESPSGKHQSQRESGGETSSQRESSSKDSSQKQSSSISSSKDSSQKQSLSKHVAHKQSPGKTSSDKESSSKHSSQTSRAGISQTVSQSLPPVFKDSSGNVSSEKLPSLEESFSESFPGDTTKSSSSGKLAVSRDGHKVTEGSSRAGISQTVSQSKKAVTFSTLDLDDEENSCGMSFEEMLNYDVALSKIAAKAKKVPSKNAADVNLVLKQDDDRFATDYSGSQSSGLPDFGNSFSEKDRVVDKVSRHIASDSKKSHSSKSEGSSKENRKTESNQTSSSLHHKLESSGSKEQSRSSSNHNKSDSKNNKEHGRPSSTRPKSESISIKNYRIPSSSHHQKAVHSSIIEPGKSGSSSSSHGSESGNKKYADDSKDENSKPREQRTETKELGHKSGKSTSEMVRNVAVNSDADSEDVENNGMSFEDFLNYNASVSQKKSSAKTNRLNATEIKDKVENKLLYSKNDRVDGLSLSHLLVSMPLPKQEELDLNLDGDGLPLYPSMRQELQTKKNNVEKFVNLERRYGQKMIYSGKRQATVPTAMTSLFAACMQVLQENIDDITFVGGIPADIIKPVLEVCSVSQLEKLEFYNPQFVGDTEDLWKIHCHRDFRGYEPEELESWRELYLRLQDARNKKLTLISRSVMANKKRAEKEVPRIQLTYVDHGHGTGRRTSKKLAAAHTAAAAAAASASDETLQPRSKQEILDSLKNQVSKPMIRRRGGNRPEIKSVSKPSAPLMQKTLKFLKGMKR